VPVGLLLPDLRDPATRGAVLELVREAWAGEPLEAPSAVVCDGRWRVEAWTTGDLPDLCDLARGDSEAEALVVALERVPRRAT
jgi:hypothetical protein